MGGLVDIFLLATSAALIGAALYNSGAIVQLIGAFFGLISRAMATVTEKRAA
jgi:hypothetical protein